MNPDPHDPQNWDDDSPSEEEIARREEQHQFEAWEMREESE